MKILFCSRWFPYPPDNGSKIRIFNLIKQLSLRHELELISFNSEIVSNESLAVMGRYCQRVEVVHYRSFKPNGLKALLGLFSRQPRSVVDTYSVEMRRLVEQAGSRGGIDAVIVSQIDMAPYALFLPEVPKIFEEVELSVLYEQFVKQKHQLKKLRNGLTWWKLSHYTAQLLSRFNGWTVVSESERERVCQLLNNRHSTGFSNLRVVPNGVDVAYYAGDFDPPEADTLVYSGALSYNANFDAIYFFLREIYPLIQAERPWVKFYVTGKVEGVPIDYLPQNDSVVFTGYLDDIRPRVGRSWVSIVPLQIGGGTRLKILEALALGTPVVSTSKGVEGLDLVPGRDLLVADAPADFAAAVLSVLKDHTLRETLSHYGRLAVKKYDWEKIGQEFSEFVEKVVAKDTRLV